MRALNETGTLPAVPGGIGVIRPVPTGVVRSGMLRRRTLRRCRWRAGPTIGVLGRGAWWSVGRRGWLLPERRGWLGDVEVTAECFADHVARGRVIVGGSLDRGAKGGVESDGNDVGWASSEWWAAASAWFERVDIDVTGDLVGEGINVSVAEDASGLGDVGLALGRKLVEVSSSIEIVPMQTLAMHMAEIADKHRVSTLGAEAIAASEHLRASLVVWAGDDGPGIRTAAKAGRVVYRTMKR